jgi:membrane-associated phospholipid phosphatase
VIPALLAVPLVALVGASRLKLRRHTLSQVIAGTLVGMILPTVFFLVTLN